MHHERRENNFHTGRYDQVFLSLVTFDNECLKDIIYAVLNIKVKEC